MKSLLSRLPKSAALVPLALILAGCVVEAARVTDAALEVAPGQPTGYLVGAVGIVASGPNDSPAARNTLRIRSVETGAILDLNFSGNSLVLFSSTDIREGDNKAALFRKPLPPGEYEIFKAYFYMSNGYVEETFENAESFSLPLRIEAGQELYIGEFIASGIKSKNMLGMRSTTGYRFDIRDRSARDFPLLKAKFPEFSPERTIISLPASALIIDPPNFVVVPVQAAGVTAP